MIVKIHIEPYLKYLKEAESQLAKIKLPFTDDVDRDIDNKTALIVAQANLSAVTTVLEIDMKKEKV